VKIGYVFTTPAFHRQLELSRRIVLQCRHHRGCSRSWLRRTLEVRGRPWRLRLRAPTSFRSISSPSSSTQTCD